MKLIRWYMNTGPWRKGVPGYKMVLNGMVTGLILSTIIILYFEYF